jgi:Xaa-Pro aminopeptidase
VAKNVSDHRVVQAIAKSVLDAISATLGPRDTEASIAHRAVTMLASKGVTETWYYDCPAYVLLGTRSTLSISGRDYAPNSEAVGMFNLITIDLSPMVHGVWGDCARSFYVENGTASEPPSSPQFSIGASMERFLHEAMVRHVTPDTTFEDLFRFSNDLIQREGFENLDFLGNVGHSIESAREDRRFIEQGNKQRLGDATLFTFEPHIRARGGPWGFKHENIYYFDADGRAVEL